MINAKKYRWFLTSSGKLVIGGKNAEQNEELMNSVDKRALVAHTAAPGSPFCIVESDSKKATQEDTHETALFCAKYSQVWKKAKVRKDVEVHFFLGKDVFKDKSMKTGTFGVKKVKKVIAKARDIENFKERKE